MEVHLFDLLVKEQIYWNNKIKNVFFYSKYKISNIANNWTNYVEFVHQTGSNRRIMVVYSLFLFSLMLCFIIFLRNKFFCVFYFFVKRMKYNKSNLNLFIEDLTSPINRTSTPLQGNLKELNKSILGILVLFFFLNL